MIDLPEMPPIRESVFQVLPANLGVYLGVSPLSIPDAAMSGCRNVRIRDGKITNRNVGYELFFASGINLGNHTLLIDDFVQTNGTSITIFGTKEDLFQYDSGSNEPKYITPTYATGTVAVTNGSAVVTLTGSGWTANVKVGDKFHAGSAAQVDTDAIWYEVLTRDSDTQITLTANYAGSTLSGLAYTIRKLFTATDLDYWDTEVFPDAPLGTTSGLAAGDHWFATNGTELVVWNGVVPQVVVLATATTGLNFACKNLTYYKNMMLYGNLFESSTTKPSNAKNSAIADPENVTTLEANEFIFLEGVDEILAMVRLGDMMVIYGANSVAIAQFVNVPLFFAIRTVQPGIGIYGPRTYMDFGDYHEFLSQDRAYRFDGVRLTPFGEQIFPDVLQRADRARSAKSYVQQSKEELEVYWVIALSTDVGNSVDQEAVTAHVEHYAESVGRAPIPFTIRDLPSTAAGLFVDAGVGRFSDFGGQGFDDVPFPMSNSFFTSEFPVVLIGDKNGVVWRLNTVSKLGTSSQMFSLVASPFRPVVDGVQSGIVTRIEPFLEENPAGIPINVRTQTIDRVGGAGEQGVVGSIDPDHLSSRFADERTSGRYARVIMYTAKAGPYWTLDGYRITVQATGGR